MMHANYRRSIVPLGDETMENPYEERLLQLRTEFESGQQVMTGLDRQRSELSQTLLRISGAIQVLEELQAENGAGSNNSDSPVDVLADERLQREAEAAVG